MTVNYTAIIRSMLPNKVQAVHDMHDPKGRHLRVILNPGKRITPQEISKVMSYGHKVSSKETHGVHEIVRIEVRTQ